MEGFTLAIDIRQPDNRLAPAGKRHCFEAGKTLYLAVRLKNVSNEKLNITDAYPESDFRIDLLDSKGKIAPLTLYGKNLRLTRLNQWANVRNTISPGESLKYELNLSRQFDLSVMGTYTVQASRRVPKMGGGRGVAVVKSNALIFELR